jgi:hypothetical protein
MTNLTRHQDQTANPDGEAFDLAAAAWLRAFAGSRIPE